MRTQYLLIDDLYADVEYDYDPQCYSDGDPTELPDVTINEVLIGDDDLMVILNDETLVKIKEHCLEHYRDYMTD